MTATILRPSSADSETAEVRDVPLSLRRWQPDSALKSWLWTLLVTAFAAATRFWALGFPDQKIFDEVYYATEGQEMLRYGYEDNRDYMFIVHPPLGKWLIGLTSAIFGDNSLGWRVAPAIAGVVSVLIVTRLAMRMFHSTLLGVLAGVLLTMDGISLVMSRTALLDIFLQTFVIAGFAALVIDRDKMRARLGDLYAAGVDLTSGVPSLGPRPWRLVGGVLLGLACAVKWSGLSFWLGFALLSLLWDRGAFKAAGVDSPWLAAVKRSWPGGFFSLGVSAVAAYLLAWTGWFVGENSWNRHWGDTHPGTGLMALMPSGIRSLLDYHNAAYQFHSHLYSPHTYKANPWSWLVLGRPISFYYPDSPQGCGAFKVEGGQRVADCSREILLIGTPVMYWAILPALGWLLWHWVTTRDWRAGAIWMAFLVGWGVWLQNTRRTGFLFYMTPLMPFLILGLTMAVGVMLGRAAEDEPLASVIDRPSARGLGGGADPGHGGIGATSSGATGSNGTGSNGTGSSAADSSAAGSGAAGSGGAGSGAAGSGGAGSGAAGSGAAGSAAAGSAAASSGAAGSAAAGSAAAGSAAAGFGEGEVGTGHVEEVRMVGLREWIRLRGISNARLLRTGLVTLWLGAVVADFIWMWPIFTGGLLTHSQWNARMWFPSWI